ncbi:MAG: prepilin-type N-terminal cleavage/methylation domain-containing protein [Planctomycetota bacterium]
MKTLWGDLRSQDHKGNRRRGLSMIEVMVAIVVLLVAATAAFSSQMTSMRLVQQSRDRGVALADMTACMEAIRSTPPDNLAEAGPFAHGVPVAAYDDLHLRDEQIVVTYPGYVAGGALPDPLVVVLTANWRDDRGGLRQARLMTVRAQ